MRVYVLILVVHGSCNARCEGDAECDSDVSLVFKLPFWIEEDDVTVDITDRSLSVTVRNELDFRRSFWRNRCVMPGCQLPLLDARAVPPGATSLLVRHVRNSIPVGAMLSSRCYRQEEEKSRTYQVVDVPESLWILDDGVGSDGKRLQELAVTLARPGLTEDEIMWKGEIALRFGRTECSVLSYGN